MSQWQSDRGAVARLTETILAAADFTPERVFVSSVERFAELAETYAQLVVAMGADLPGGGVTPLSRSLLPSQPDLGEAASLARAVRSALGWGEGPIADHLLALASQHSLVFRLPLADRQSGFFYNHPSVGFCVVVNSRMNLGRHLLALAAQLGHAFCHSHLRALCVPNPERSHQRMADRFASQLLVPDSALAKAVGSLGGGVEPSHPVAALHLQRMFGVSFALIAVRLRQCGLISVEEYHRMGRVSPTALAPGLGYAPNPVDRGRGANPPALATAPRPMLQLVCAALAKTVLTRTQAAQMLGIPTESVSALGEYPPIEKPESAVWAEMDQLGGW